MANFLERLIDPSVKLGTSTAEPLGDFRAGPNTDGASVAAPKFHLVGRAADHVLQVCPTLRWREMDSNHRSPVDTLGDTDTSGNLD
jgi:hypothetical protein